MSLQYVGNTELMTVITGSLYTAGDPTLTLLAGQGALLPATGTFWIRQASLLQSSLINILKVTARTGDVLTVVGGQDGTTDQNILTGTIMCWVLSASALQQLTVDISSTPWLSAITSKGVNYPLTATDQIVLCTNNITITLPTAVGISGRWYIVKKMDAPGTVVSIQTTAAQTIDGQAPPLDIIGQYQSWTLVSNGANWFII